MSWPPTHAEKERPAWKNVPGLRLFRSQCITAAWRDKKTEGTLITSSARVLAAADEQGVYHTVGLWCRHGMIHRPSWFRWVGRCCVECYGSARVVPGRQAPGEPLPPAPRTQQPGSSPHRSAASPQPQRAPATLERTPTQTRDSLEEGQRRSPALALPAP